MHMCKFWIWLWSECCIICTYQLFDIGWCWLESPERYKKIDSDSVQTHLEHQFPALEGHWMRFCTILGEFEIFNFFFPKLNPFFIVKMCKNCYFGQILPSQAQYLEHLRSQKQKLVKNMCLALAKSSRNAKIKKFGSRSLEKVRIQWKIRKTIKNRKKHVIMALLEPRFWKKSENVSSLNTPTKNQEKFKIAKNL